MNSWLILAASIAVFLLCARFWPGRDDEGETR